MLDHRLRMDGRLQVGRELAHRRRAAEPFGGRFQLREDLLVGVALTQARLELGQCDRVDLPQRPRGLFTGHVKKDRASWRKRKSALAAVARVSWSYEAAASSAVAGRAACGGLSPGVSAESTARTRSRAPTQRGQNWEPAARRSSSSASLAGRAAR